MTEELLAQEAERFLKKILKFFQTTLSSELDIPQAFVISKKFQEKNGFLSSVVL